MAPGTYILGPEHGRLTVHTGKAGAASKAGHDLLIEVGAWNATLQVAGDLSQSRLELTADSRSLRVLEGSGGMSALDDGDRSGIAKTIDEEVLKGTAIAFRSTQVSAGDDGGLNVTGELELAGATRPIAFELRDAGDGRLTGRAVVTQTTWGMKPYSALFGTLKVSDVVQIAIDARLPDPS